MKSFDRRGRYHVRTSWTPSGYKPAAVYLCRRGPQASQIQPGSPRSPRTIRQVPREATA
jgi:hypothetical protein